VVVQTSGVEPSDGSMNLPTIGSSRKISAAPTSSASEYSIVTVGYCRTRST
jgi:hypothetical protein